MPMFARSDVMHVSVSRAHGGCGKSHSRPVRDGSPAKLWQLDCPQCREFLSSDPLWSGTPADIPSTPDEVAARENVDKTTQRSRDDIMTYALAKIAGLPAADLLGEIIGQTAAKGTVTCRDGHDNVPTAKFCAECGAKLGDDVSAPIAQKAGTVAALPPAPKAEAASEPAGTDEKAEKPARATREVKSASQRRRATASTSLSDDD